MGKSSLMTFWLSDVRRIENKLVLVFSDISRSRITPLLKDAILNDLRVVLRLLKKGREK